MTDTSLGSAVGVVVGATDVAATLDFLARFDFTHVTVVDTEAHARVSGGHGVPIIVVAATGDGSAPRAYEQRARAIDIYTGDLDAALAALDGEQRSPIGVIGLGPVKMRQALVNGPDGLPIVLVESTHRRASILDTEPHRLFSDPHSVVWCVADRDAEAAWWVEQHAMTKGMDLAFEEPAVSEYLGLPDSPVRIEMTMLSDASVSSLRLELLAFPDHPSEPAAIGVDVAGIRALRFGSGDAPIAASPGGIAYQS